MSWLSLIPLFFISPTFGADYPRQLRRVDANRVEISHAMHRIGFRDELDKEAASQDPAAKKSLFQIHAALNSSLIPQGKLLFGRLINRLVVGGDGTPALIEFEQDQGFLSGLRAMGTGRPAATQGRVALDFTRLLLRGGKSVAIQSLGLDEEGAQGIVAQVLSSKALSIMGSMAGSLISGLAAAQQTQVPTGFGFSQVEPSGRNGLLQGVAQVAADQSKRMIEDATTEKPILIVEANTPVTLLVQEEAKW